MTKVSVIIPAHNVEKYISQTIESILNQTINDLEVLCVYDGSKDDTLEILKEFAQKDKRIKIIYTELTKPGIARNFGLEQANGEFVLFLDGDDFLEENALEILVDKISKDNSDMVIFDVYHYFEKTKTKNPYNFGSCYYSVFKGKPFSPSEIYEKIFDNISGYPFKFYRRDFLIENDIRYSNHKFVEDSLPLFKSLICAKKISTIDFPLLNYRIHQENSSLSVSKYFDDIFSVFFECEQEILKHKDSIALLPSFLNNRVNQVLFWYKKIEKSQKQLYYKKMRALFKYILKNYSQFLNSNFPYTKFDFVVKNNYFFYQIFYKISLLKYLFSSYFV